MKNTIYSYKEILRRSLKEIGFYFVNLYKAKRLIAIGALIVVIAIILIIYLTGNRINLLNIFSLHEDVRAFELFKLSMLFSVTITVIIISLIAFLGYILIIILIKFSDLIVNLVLQIPLNITSEYYYTLKQKETVLRQKTSKGINIFFLVTFLFATFFIIYVLNDSTQGLQDIRITKAFVWFVIGTTALAFPYFQYLKHLMIKEDASSYFPFLSKESIRYKIVILSKILIAIILFKEYILIAFVSIIMNIANPIWEFFAQPVRWFGLKYFIIIGSPNPKESINILMGNLMNIFETTGVYNNVEYINSHTNSMVINFLIVVFSYDLILTLISKSIFLKRRISYYLIKLGKVLNTTIVLILIVWLTQYIMEIKSNSISAIINQPFLLGLYFSLLIALYEDDNENIGDIKSGLNNFSS